MAIPQILLGATRVIRGSRLAKKIIGRSGQKSTNRKTYSRKSNSALTIRPKTTLIPAERMSSAIVRVPKVRNVVSYDEKISNIQSNLTEIDSILKGTFAMEKQDADRKRKSENQQKRSALENQVEKKNGILKNLGKKLPKLPTKSFGFLSWIQNFIGSLILAYAVNNFSGLLPTLTKLLPLISGTMDIVIDIGGKLLNGLSTFIDLGYKAYDWTRGAIKNIGGDTLVGAFDTFTKTLDFVINALLLATFARGFGRDLPGKNKGKGNRGPGGRTRRGRVPITRTGGSATPRGRLGRMFGPIANKFRFNPFTGARVTQSGGVRNPFRARPNVTKGGGFKNPFRTRPNVTQSGGFKNPFRTRPNVTGGTPRGGMKIPKLPKLPFGGVARGLAGPFINALLAIWDFSDRKSAGQTNVQAGVGTGGGILGGIAGAALAATLFPEPFSSAAGLLTLGILGAIGYSVGGSGADKLTGADQVGQYEEGGKVKKKGIRRTLKKSKKRTILKTPKKPVFKSLQSPPAPDDGVSKESETKQRAWWDFLGWAGTGEQQQPVGPVAQATGNKIFDVGNQLGKNNYFGPIIQMTSKLILNKNVQDSDYTAVGDGINLLIRDGINKERIARGMKGFSSGGRIDGSIGNIYVTDWVSSEFKKSISSAISINSSIKTSDKNSEDGSPSSSASTPSAGTSSGSTSGSVYGSTEMRALLDVLAYAEGTGTNRNGATGPAGYSTWAGYQMHGPSDLTGLTIQEVHDLQTSFINSGKVNMTGSAVVGKYQFKDLLKHYAPQAGLNGDDLFSPENQDKMAIAEIQAVGITTNKLKTDGLTQSTLDILAPIWASMPYSPKGGGSYYKGQPSKSASELIDFYKERSSFIMNKKQTPTSNLEPSDTISSGTGGEMVRSERGTKLAGDLGRYIYKTLIPAAKAPDGVGDFSYASEHPDFGGSFKRSYPSWHNVDRAIDIGGFWPKDQKKIIAKIMEFNEKFGVKPVELLYGKPGTPEADTHGDHVHVAYEKGGLTLDRPHMALMGEKGTEIVIDADSAGPAKEMLLAINQASGRTGVMKAIKDYAPYEELEPSTVIINKNAIMNQISQNSKQSPSMVIAGGNSENFTEFLEMQG